MEYWSYACRGKGFISDESVSAPNAVPKCKDGSMGWELKTPRSFENNSQGAIENQGFVALGFPEMMSKSLSNGSIGDVLGSRICGGRMFSSVTDSRNAFSGEKESKESSSKLSSSIVESNCGDSALIDLKLGRFADQRDAQSFNSKTTPNFSSAESYMPAKRARVGGLSSSTPFCQVHGCKKDLSSSKDYYKRHKVCDVHSKTAKVIVNGIEQRFCQQCSRFHLLSEFDDGKRSCRKRLAGHNERRRKPHVGIHYGRPGRLFQSYNGSRFQGNSVTTASFICQDTYPSSLLHPEKYETNDWCRNIKLEDGADYSSQSAIPIANGQLHHPKSPFPSDGFEKHCTPLHDNGVSTRTGIKSNGNSNRYQHDMASSNFVPHSLFQNTSLGGESFTAFDSASTVQAPSGVSDSGCALSLLSSQSQNSSSHSAGVPMAHPLILPANHPHCSVNQISEKLVERSPQASMSGVSNKFIWSGINSLEANHLDPILISDGSDAVNFGIDGMLQGSAEDRPSCDGGPTIDLLQLSSQLQRVEHQRQSQQVKQGHNSFCGLRIT